MELVVTSSGVNWEAPLTSPPLASAGIGLNFFSLKFNRLSKSECWDVWQSSSSEEKDSVFPGIAKSISSSSDLSTVSWE